MEKSLGTCISKRTQVLTAKTICTKPGESVEYWKLFSKIEIVYFNSKNVDLPPTLDE